jgi:hypothetical protein
LPKYILLNAYKQGHVLRVYYFIFLLMMQKWKDNYTYAHKYGIWAPSTRTYFHNELKNQRMTETTHMWNHDSTLTYQVTYPESIACKKNYAENLVT